MMVWHVHCQSASFIRWFTKVTFVPVSNDGVTDVILVSQSCVLMFNDAMVCGFSSIEFYNLFRSTTVGFVQI